nr:PREDICTED: uncharacterized protein LOC107397567 [Tribolium castaneum]|eukprot:XP_015833679.1 PREDICTED: uncharacterized protein LOC107397567 [Tribolium castaneum]
MASDIPSNDNQALIFFDDSIRDFEKIALRFRNIKESILEGLAHNHHYYAINNPFLNFETGRQHRFSLNKIIYWMMCLWQSEERCGYKWTVLVLITLYQFENGLTKITKIGG